MRNGVPNVEARAADEDLPTAVKPHYSVIELASLWGWSRNTITRQFADEPGARLMIIIFRRKILRDDW
jgi:AraC-like DNA-binding protein